MSDPAVDLLPLGQVLKKYDLEPHKSLGQNFLLDPSLTRKIALATGPLGGVNVVEVGPGPGGLTRAILAAGAAHVVAIERDQRCLPALAELADAYPGRLEVISADALTVDLASLIPSPRRLIANLPYNVGTPLLVQWLRTITAWDALGLMFQKEVAQRITAKPGDKNYGRLGILTQWLTEPSIAFDVPPGAFIPPPKVTSSVVVIRARPEPLAICRFQDLERVTAAAFGQRRKMLRSSLKTLGLPTDRLCAEAGVDPTMRAEELPIQAFCALARSVKNQLAIDTTSR